MTTRAPGWALPRLLVVTLVMVGTSEGGAEAGAPDAWDSALGARTAGSGLVRSSTAYGCGESRPFSFSQVRV